MDRTDPRLGKTSVLFVCLGNICRSPLAEGVFRHLAEARGLGDAFQVDSGGTGAWHVGEPPDRRSVEVARHRGISLNGRARKVQPEDLRRFAWIIAMDRENLEDLQALAAAHDVTPRIHLLREFDPAGGGDDVPDPYYGGPDGFENVFRMVYRSCDALLDAMADSDAP